MPRRSPPAKSLEARENQLILQAVDLVEQRMANGTATASEILHYLKLGTTRERLEKEKLAHENELLRARTESIQAMKHDGEKYEAALKAMLVYNGEAEEDNYD